MIVFGPVPSRRLGRSLGINNIPPKICTYSCVYCQLGRTNNMQVERKGFYKPAEVVAAVKKKIKELEEKKEPIDYLTFVPDGEPTLDVNLGREIEALRPLGIKIAVITNASLMFRKEVRQELQMADWVSLKVDTVDEGIWRMINRPHPSLKFDEILKGVIEFKQSFKGELCTETMVVDGINDDEKCLKDTADFVAKLSPYKGYISVPIRPPAEKWVKIPGEDALNKVYHFFKERGLDVEYLVGYEGNEFAFTGNIEDDILSIASVHPIREDGMTQLLERANASWGVVETLKREGRLVEVKYRGKRFYVRNLSKRV